jgi:predicted transcriptional regulator
LKQAAERKQSGQQIADLLGRSRAAVYLRAKKLGIPIRSADAPSSHTWTIEEERKLDLLAKQCLGASEIASRMERSIHAVRKRANILSIVLTAAPRPRHRVKLPVQDILRRFDRGASVNVIAKNYCCDNGTVECYLAEHGRKPRAVVRHLELTSTACNIIAGLLLGDGSLSQSRRAGRSPSLRIGQAVKRVGWLRHIAKRLLAEGWQIRLYERCLSKRPCTIDGRKINGGRSFQLESLNYHELKEERARWYPRVGPKRVPKDLRLTPEIVADWFCGDGTYSKTGQLSFCTDGFAKECVEFLIERLAKDMGITSTLQRRTPERFAIGVCRLTDAYKLAQAIRPRLPQCCLYKLKHVRPFQGRWP